MEDFAPGMHSHAAQAGWYAEPVREHNATEVGRIIARYIADTTSFQRGNALVRSEMKATSKSAGAGRAKMAQYGKYGVLAVGAALVGSLKSFALYDVTMNRLQANTGANANMMKKLRAEAVKLGGDARFPAVTASNAADAMFELAKGGLNAQEVLKASEPVMLMATAGQMDFGDAATIAVNAMNAFEMPATKLPKVMDDIAGAALASSSEISGIAEAFRYTSTFAHKLQVPIDQVTTMAGLLSNAGLEGDMAGTSMRMFFTSLTGRSKKAIEEMKGLGIINKKGANMFFDKDGTMKDFDEVGRIWRKVTKGMKPNKAMSLERDIFGVRGANVAGILDKMGKKGGKLNWHDMFMKSTAGAGTKKGAASRLAEANTKGLYGSYQRIVNIVQTLGLEIGQKLAPHVQKIMDTISKFFEMLANNKKAVNDIAKAIEIVIGAFIAWKAVMIATAVIQKVLYVAGVLYRTALVAIRAPMALVRLAQWQLNAAMAANPIGIIIVAIIALILVLRHFGVGLDDVTRIAKLAWTKIKSYFFGALHWITGFFKAHWKQALVVALTGPFAPVILLIMAKWKQIKGFFTSAWTWVKNVFHKYWKDALLVALLGPWGPLAVLIRHKIGLIKTEIGKIVGYVTGIATRVYNAALSLGSRLKDGILDGLKGLATGIANKVISAIPGAKSVVNAGGWIAGQFGGHRAGGGSVYAGRSYMVGERGPEMFTPGGSGHITPNHGLRKGGPTVNIEHMSVASVEDPYVIASVLERRMAFAQ